MLAREKWQVSTLSVLEELFEERKRQVARYGHNEDLKDGTGSSVQWLLPYTADVAWGIEGELRVDYEEFERENGCPTWMHLLREELAEVFQETDPDRLRTELVQLGALCVSWIEKIRRRLAEEEAE